MTMGLQHYLQFSDLDAQEYGWLFERAAVIKKKMGGTYYSMASAKIFPGTYHKQTNPTLLPQRQWMGLRLVTEDESDGSVTLTLYLDRNNTGNYEEVARATDRPGSYGTSVISGPGHAGIRTDYQDVLFDDYKLTTI